MDKIPFGLIFFEPKHGKFVEGSPIAEFIKRELSTIENIIISLLKSVIFGMIISGSATMYGFNAGRASTDIPLAGLFAVSKAFLYIFLADDFVTVLSYVL